MESRVVLLAALAAIVGACAGDEAELRMHTRIDDATAGQCRRTCDERRDACAKRERKPDPTRLPGQPGDESWQDLYRDAQALARRCDQQHRRCTSRCLD